MKKTLIAFIALFVFISNAYAENYDALYDAAEPFQSKLYNDIDPFEDQDNIIYAWSPYPLFRTSAELYFKDYKIYSQVYPLQQYLEHRRYSL